MVAYHSTLDTAPMPLAEDFFEGWPTRPGQDVFLTALRGSHAVELAVEDGRVIGFANAISDGVAAAFIPWLEVVPTARGRRVGVELMRRLIERMSGMYSIDLVCDEGLAPYYARMGMAGIRGFGIRHPGNLR